MFLCAVNFSGSLCILQEKKLDIYQIFDFDRFILIWVELRLGSDKSVLECIERYLKWSHNTWQFAVNKI